MDPLDVQIIECTTSGLCISKHGAAVYLTEELRHAETNPEIHEAIARHTKIRDQNPSLAKICP